MISLQKLFGKTDVFYNLLEASAEEAQNSIQALSRLLAAPVAEQSLDELVLSRRKDKKIKEQIDEAICKVFVSELEREDVEALSNALYKIPKTVEKIAERYIICAGRLQGVEFNKQLSMMTSAAATVVEMVRQLRQKLHLERIQDLNDKLQLVEGQADKLVLDLLRDLYNSNTDAIQVIMLRDLYDLMEKVVDRCRDSGNIVSHIVLKYS